jgi:hypothetical protein
MRFPRAVCRPASRTPGPRTLRVALDARAAVAPRAVAPRPRSCGESAWRADIPARPAPHSRPTEAKVAAWQIDVRTEDGAGLPSGSGAVAAGKAVFEAKCAACLGAGAAGGPVYGIMVGGIGSFQTERRGVTPGRTCPFAPVPFDDVRRAMPMNAPRSLANDEVCAVSALPAAPRRPRAGRCGDGWAQPERGAHARPRRLHRRRPARHPGLALQDGRPADRRSVGAGAGAVRARHGRPAQARQVRLRPVRLAS